MSIAENLPPKPSERLLGILEGYEQVLVVMHDNPDPDAIASGWAVCRLVVEGIGHPARLIGGGAIVRAENKHLVRLLAPPLELVCELSDSEGTAVVLVDCGLGKSNHLVTRTGIHPVAIIDHHTTDGDAQEVPFCDVRPNVAASASITASYLREQHIEPSKELATAILYAIRSETRGTETRHSRLDRKIISWMTKLADATVLAEIENAPLDRSYYGDLVLAMQNTFVYDDVAVCMLPRASCAEIVGEFADLLIRGNGISRVLCAALVNSDLLLSARTEKGAGSATEILQATLNGLGGCGGHSHRAGGSISNIGSSGRSREDLQGELRSRWLAACDVDRQRGTRLVARREILENL